MIIIAAVDEVHFVDSNQVCGTLEARTLEYFLYEGLVREGPNSRTIVPLLAESWTISNNGLTYTVKLKLDIKFKDFNSIIGEDWIWPLSSARNGNALNPRTAAEHFEILIYI